MTIACSTKLRQVGSLVCVIITSCCLFSCQLTKKEVPEPNFDPYVLKSGEFFEAQPEMVVSSILPPDTFKVKPEWVDSEKLESISLDGEGNGALATGAASILTALVPIDRSKFEPPDYHQSTGIQVQVSIPQGTPVDFKMLNEQHRYIATLDQIRDQILCLLEDKFGRIWIGRGMLGLSIWDGKRLINISSEQGFPDGTVNDLFSDSRGNIWIATAESGVLVWNGIDFVAFNTNNGLSDDFVSTVEEDQLGNIWIGTRNGLNIWDGEGFHQYFTEQGLTHNNIMAVEIDTQGAAWIGTWGGGVTQMSGSNLKKITTDQGLSSNQVVNVFSDSHGSIWIATASSGVNRLDGESLHFYSSLDGFPVDWTGAILEDSEGKIWLGGNHGVSYYDGQSLVSIPEFNNQKYSMAFALLEDSSGHIWIGTTHSGIHRIANSNSKHIVSDESLWWRSGYQNLAEDSNGNIWVLGNKLGLVPKNRKGIMNRVSIPAIGRNLNVEMLEDFNGNLMIGSGLNTLILANSKTIGEDPPRLKYYRIPTVTSENIGAINSLLTLRNNQILIGINRGHGLFIWEGAEMSDMENAQFLHFGKKHGFNIDEFNTMIEDNQGRVWIGSGEGILIWDGTSIKSFSGVAALSKGRGVNDMSLDVHGNIWIATMGSGIGVYNGRGFKWYNQELGLPTNIFHSIEVDENGDVWGGSHAGLIKLWVGDNGEMRFKSLNEYHGVGSSIVRDVIVDQDKTLWVGSQQNLDIIDLKQKDDDKTKPNLALLTVQPFFDHFDWRELNQVLANGQNMTTSDQGISVAKVKYDAIYAYTNLPKNLELPYDINHLSFDWNATYWPDPRSIQYTYILEGKDHTWSPLIGSRKVTYTGLEPGEYTLKVRAVAGNAQWSDTEQYTFTITPPLWATWWAYGLYGLCALGFVLGWRHFERKRLILSQKAKALEELDKTKSEFFTNISHELRTPLTLILGPLKALKQETYKGDRETLFDMMYYNGSRLLKLVNQMLDLSKLDDGKLHLELQDCDLNALVGQVLANFDSACSMKEIVLEFEELSDPIHCRLDIEKIKQVIGNLVGNAIKFTPEGGQIRVTTKNVGEEQGKPVLKIAVQDSGIGIEPHEMDHIFDRFYQVNNADQDESAGTGIGLALSKKLVKLHEGSIVIDSKPGLGSTFTVTLPYTPTKDRLVDIVPIIKTDPKLTKKELGAISDLQPPGFRGKPILLIVEDNSQMRQFIKSCLSTDYDFLEAVNGEEGLRKADEIPDLILCDVMMPKMDGFEFCKVVRESEATAHIPFIFLTARADLDSRLRGLKIGSNDYLVKPFEAEELRLKVGNHLEKMQQYRTFFSKQLAIRGEIDTVESLDNVFLDKTIKAIEERLDDHEFNVEKLTRHIGLSQPQLYRKLVSLTGKSPSAFIRGIRLKKAAQLIVQDFGNTSDVAYAVGFNNVSYFAKCFKEQFGISPSAYGRKHSYE